MDEIIWAILGVVFTPLAVIYGIRRYKRDKHRNRIGVVISLFGLYLLSFGPAFRIASQMPSARGPVIAVYLPLLLASESSFIPISVPLKWYVDLWR